MHDFRKLHVWKDAVKLSKKVYVLSNTFPKEEIYGLINQIRRAVVSVASNIAEGAGRGSDREFQKFLRYSQGSCYELETQIIIANDLGYIQPDDFKPLINDIIEVEKKIHNLIKSLDNE